jgi:methylase of polypeptide subunit release factors
MSETSTFGPLTVRFDDRVLVPRQWTLMQSEWAAELAERAPEGALLELCAGAGHIGLAAAKLSGRSLVQVEADDVAACYARQNATDAGMQDRVDVRHATVDDALDAAERFAVILADPPYLPSVEIARWPNDPVRAIDGGADGLQVIRACLRVAVGHLVAGGAFLLQVAGASQADAVADLAAAATPRVLRHRETREHDDERAVMLFTRDR